MNIEEFYKIEKEILAKKRIQSFYSAGKKLKGLTVFLLSQNKTGRAIFLFKTELSIMI